VELEDLEDLEDLEERESKEEASNENQLQASLLDPRRRLPHRRIGPADS
jgi:hypothetical protein